MAVKFILVIDQEKREHLVNPEHIVAIRPGGTNVSDVLLSNGVHILVGTSPGKFKAMIEKATA